VRWRGRSFFFLGRQPAARGLRSRGAQRVVVCASARQARGAGAWASCACVARAVGARVVASRAYILACAILGLGQRGCCWHLSRPVDSLGAAAALARPFDQLAKETVKAQQVRSGRFSGEHLSQAHKPCLLKVVFAGEGVRRLGAPPPPPERQPAQDGQGLLLVSYFVRTPRAPCCSASAYQAEGSSRALLLTRLLTKIPRPRRGPSTRARDLS
jgi:hypothetical protein